jgi:ADP-ribosylglycohydrolase
MKGAIIGDIIGSTREFMYKVTTKDFTLFPKESRFTDDTVLTIAVYDSLINNTPYEQTFYKWIEKYPDRGYGGMFFNWILSKNKKPYASKGNGSAMRVSPVGWLFNTEQQVLNEAKRSAEITHNSTEGIQAAQAVAITIYLARTGKSKEEIKEYLEKNFTYDISHPLDYVKEHYKYNELAAQTVPQCITCFLESNSFEDSIRNAISLAGDADTLASITGSMAEAYYGIDEDMWNEAKKFLPEDILTILS